MKIPSAGTLVSIALVFIFLVPAITTGCSKPATPPAQSTNTTPSQPPVITSLTAPQQAEALSVSPIQVIATGSDNLSYQWFASNGTIIGTGANVNWKAPDTTGDMTIDLVVSNNDGKEAKKSVTITVTPRPLKAPIFKSFTITRTGQNPITVSAESTTPVQVAKFRPAIIVCNAEDPEGGPLQFLWYAPFGTLEPNKDNLNIVKFVTSQDSNKQGDCVLTVTAINSKGARAKTSLIIHIPCCAD